VVQDATTDVLLKGALAALKTDASATAKLDCALVAAASAADGSADAAFRELLPNIAVTRPPSLKKAAGLLRQHMDAVGSLLAARWEDERYVRKLEDVDDDPQE
jgi:hypothetical protein